MSSRRKYTRDEGMVLCNFISDRQAECLNSIKGIDELLATPGKDSANLPGQRQYYVHVAGFLKRCMQLARAKTDWTCADEASE